MSFFNAIKSLESTDWRVVLHHLKSTNTTWIHTQAYRFFFLLIQCFTFFLQDPNEKCCFFHPGTQYPLKSDETHCNCPSLLSKTFQKSKKYRRRYEWKSLGIYAVCTESQLHLWPALSRASCNMYSVFMWNLLTWFCRTTAFFDKSPMNIETEPRATGYTSNMLLLETRPTIISMVPT